MNYMKRLEGQIKRLNAEDLHLRGGSGAWAHPPDDQGRDDAACMLWIRRQGWMAKIEPWMIEWVREGRRHASGLCNCIHPSPLRDGETIPQGLTIAHCKTCKGII